MNILKFSFIALCFAVTLLSFKKSHSKRDWLFLAVGMLLTLISDYFLVLYDNQPVGTTTFCFVHMAYILRVRSRKYLWVIIGTLLLVLPLYFATDYLITTAALYFVLFLQDIVAHMVYYRKESLPMINRRLMLAGILLFALCDINVLLFNLPRFVSLPDGLSDTAFTLIWVFYMPAQGLLAVSALRYPPRAKDFIHA